jgi:Glycosyl hydrolases family 32 N-terminal domain
MLSAGPFQRIYDASPGAGDPWYVNDHCFVRDVNGGSHLFGITHAEPANPLEEKFFTHATAPALFGPWTRREPVLEARSDWGETHVWAPYVVEHQGLYYLYYCAGGENHEEYRLHLATSPDLFAFTRHPANPLAVDGFDARDPMVLRFGDAWLLYYTATSAPDGGEHVVAALHSHDLVHWSGKRIVFRHPKRGTFGGPTESPMVVERRGKYYLFVCTNDPYDDTAVYESDSPLAFDVAHEIARLPAHAAEVVSEGERWYVSRAGWGRGGVHLAELRWPAP